MDIEDYYYRQKHSKQQKYAGSARRKGSTLRGYKADSQNGKKKTQEIVTKFIKTTDDWDAKRINEYCKNVLNDGGIEEDGQQPKQLTVDTPANLIKYTRGAGSCSAKKKKRWNLRENLRESMLEQIYCNDSTAPDISIIERTVRPISKQIPRAGWIHLLPPVRRPTHDVTRAIFTAEEENSNVQRVVVDKTPKKTFSYTTDLMGYSVKKNEKEASQKTCRPEVMYEFAYTRSDNKRWPKTTPYTTRRYYANERSKCRKNVEIEDYERGMDSDGYWSEEDYDEEICETTAGDTTENCSLELFLKNARDIKQNKQRRICVNKENEKSKISEITPKKGKIIVVSENERYTVENETVSDVSSEGLKKNVCKIQIEGRVLESFYNQYANKDTEIDSNDAIEFANLRPLVFVVPLLVSTSLWDDPCHLHFETDYDPDAFQNDNNKDGKNYLIMSVISKSKDFEEELNQYVADLLGGFEPCITEIDTIEFIIASTRSYVNTNRGNLSVPLQQNIKAKTHMLSTSPSIRENRSKRLNGVLRGFANIFDIKTEYISFNDENQLDDSSCEDERDYEFVVDVSLPKDCRLCGLKLHEESGFFAFARCRHWYCGGCWSQFIDASPRIQIKCPEKTCGERANQAARLSLMKMKKSSQQRSDSNDYVVYDCPNPSCLGITKMSSSSEESTASMTSSMVTCMCGVSKCVECGNHPHWPVSCEVGRCVATEIDIVRRKHDYLVKGKVCPRCCFFIVKMGGCDQMKCFCGLEFCWNCLLEKPVNMTQHCCSEHVPLQHIFVPTELAVSYETIEKNHLAVRKHIDSLSSDEHGFQARIRAMVFFSKNVTTHDVIDDATVAQLAKEFGYTGGGKLQNNQDCIDISNEDGRKMIKVVEDLLLVKNQFHFVIPLLQGTLTYGKLKKHVRQRLKGIQRKMENICCRAEWLMLKRDYQSRDNHFPATFQKETRRGRKLIKDVYEILHAS